MMSGKMYRFRMPEQHVSPRYMEFYLQTAQARLAIDVMKTGGSDSGLNLTQDRFRRLPVPLAPRAEQERIVVAIEEEFSRLDAGVGALERARQNLKRMRATVLERSTTGDLVDPEPSSWRTVAVGDVAEVSGGITKNPRRAPRANPIPFLRVANVPRDGLDLADIHYIEVFDGELERFRLRDGDLLVVEGNGSPDQIGRSALWTGIIDPCVHQNHLIRIRPSDEVDPRYLNLFWNAPTSMRTIQAQASSTSGLHTLSTEKVRAISVALPSISAQRQIVDEASRRLSSIGDVEAVVDDQLRLTRSLRSSILTAAFSGKLVPQDPDDEDAAVLLRRLNAERASSNGQKPAQTRKLRTRVPA
jgi:type I restriction enzyme S subunit